MKLTYEAILNDPRLLERLEAQARRERARAVRQLVVAPLKHFFADPAARGLRMRAPLSWSAHVQGRPVKG
jgi:hypothetical protein